MNLGFEKFKENLLGFLNGIAVNQIRCIGVKCDDCPLQCKTGVCLLYELQSLKLRLENKAKNPQPEFDIKTINTKELVEELKRRIIE